MQLVFSDRRPLRFRTTFEYTKTIGIMKNNAPQVVFIGAGGIGGITAAHASKAGFDVEVVDGLGFSAEALERMEALGWTVEPESRDGRFGRVHAVQWDRELRVWRGAADPDWEGAAASPRGSVR